VGEALSQPDADSLLLRSESRVGLRTVALDDGVETVADLRPPPDLSADADSILEEDLGLADHERRELYERGTVISPDVSRG